MYGSGFSTTLSDNTVEFGTATATIDSVKSNVLYVQVPSGPSGLVDVTVTSAGNTATASGRFGVVTSGTETFEAVGIGVKGVKFGTSDWGDYDNDGDLDLVVAGDSAGSGNGQRPFTRIYRNDGSGTFTAIGAGLTDLRAASVAWGDYDGDGDLDLVAAGRDGSGNNVANIYRNEGSGTFTAIGAGIDGGTSGSLEWGDFDGDGDLDLLLVGDKSDFSRATRIYRNDGGGAFNTVGAGLTGVNLSSSEWGDYDGDGDLDLVVTGMRNTATAAIYRNDGGGSFSTESGVSLTGVERGSSNWVDYDSDGDPDLFITGQQGFNDQPSSTLYRNEGGGTFSEVTTNLPPFTRSASEWGDYDGDGDPDLVVTGDTTANNDSLATRIYRNDGGGSFTNVTSDLQGLQEGSVSLGDYDGDGELDIFVNGENDSRETAATLYESVSKTPSPNVTAIRPGGGSAGTTARIYGSAFGATTGDNTVKFGTQTATVNSVSADQTVLNVQVPSGVSGPVEVTVQTNNATLTAPNPFVVAGGGDAVFGTDDTSLKAVRFGSSDWGDYDNDGDLDLIVTGVDDGGTPTATIYQNDGSGGFTALGAGLTGVDGGAADWGDYDNDGDLDLIVTGNDGSKPTSTIYRNEGGGTFTAIGAGLTGLGVSSADWGDYDGDGDLDLVVTGEDKNTSWRAIIYRNDGGGVFTANGTRLVGVKDGSADWGDYDDDGDLDLILTGGTFDSGYSATIYRNDGDGVFTDIGAGLTDVDGSSADWGDYDNDGDLDLVITGYEEGTNDKTAIIYRNDGGGTFATAGANLTGVVNGSSDWGDFDADGDLDLLVTGNDGTDESAILYRNKGSGTFDKTGAGLTEVRFSSSAWGDFDGDGELDLVITGGDGNGTATATLYPNLVPDNKPPDSPTNLSAQAFRDSVTLGWTASDSADVQTYRIYRDTSPIDGTADPSNFTALDTVSASQTAYTDTAVQLETTYYYRATALDEASNESGFSNETQGTPTLPLTITGLQPTSGAPGAAVRIQGSSFSPTAADNTVEFGSATATIDSAKSNVLYVKVPSGPRGPVPVSVTTPDGSVTAAGPFTVLTGADSTFAVATKSFAGVAFGSSDWGDYDGDGDLDLVVTGDTASSDGSAQIYRNEGGGTFAPIGAGLAGVRRSSSDWGDFDGDGDLDLVVAGDDGTPTATIYENKGGGTFTAIGAGLTGVANSSSSWGDYDGDGELDLVVTGADGSATPTTTIYRNEGNGTFTAVGAGLPGVEFGATDWGDYDGDGDLDLVLTGDASGPSATIYRNDGSATFTAIGANLTGVESSSVQWGDYDGDGDLDLAVTGSNSSGTRTATIYRNDGGGTFKALNAGLTGVWEGSSGWGDVEGNGTLDLVVTGLDNNGTPTTTIYENEGGGTFTAIGANLAGVKGSASPWGDFDGNGSLDLFVAGAGANAAFTATLYRNLADSTAPDAPTALSAKAGPDSVALDWTASDSADVVAYRLFRGTDPIDQKSRAATRSVLAEVPAGQTTYDDMTVIVDTTYHYRVAAVDEVGNESAFSNEVTATPRITFSVQEPSEPPETESTVNLTAQIPSQIAPTIGRLFYRKGGAVSFKRTDVSVTEGASEVDVQVPKTVVTERGVDYVVQLSEPLSGGDTLRATVPATRPFQNPAHLQVKVPEVGAKGPFRAKAYRMVSVPLVLDGRSAFEVLKKQYGTYDPKAWRLFRWSPVDSTYREGPTVSDSLAPGQAVWVITAEGDSLSVQDGRSVPADSAQKLRLAPGWNQVGSPFPFPVAWSRIEGTGQVQAPVGYDGSRPEGNRYQNQSLLRPWRGAFVFNSQDTTAMLRVPPVETQKGAATIQRGKTLATGSGADYRLQAIASMRVGEKRYRDRQVWMGLKEGAAPGVGAEDMPKPPGVGSRVRVATDPEEGPGLARSLKPAGGGAEGQSAAKERGAAWDLRVSAQVDAPFQTKRTVTVQLAEQGARPDGFGRWVLDLDRERRLPVRHGNLEVEVREGAARRVRVIVGTKAFAETASEGIALSVRETKLGANAPNPFAERTRIPYQLATGEEVEIAVYDVLGRRVRTLVNGKREAGVHRVTLNANGLASGVYFCRMEAGDYTETRKLTVVH